MDELIKKLNDLIILIDNTLNSETWHTEVLTDTKNKLKLYIKRFFNNNSEYIQLVNEVSTNPPNYNSFTNSLIQLKSVMITLLEDINLTENDTQILTEVERQKILSHARKEAEVELEKIQNEANEIQKMKDDLQKRTESILLEEEKLNSFKTKLEFADKGIDFQVDAKTNKNNAIFWAVIFFILLVILTVIICDNLSSDKTFSTIAKEIKIDLSNKDLKMSENIISNTIYVTYGKFIFSKIFLYSLLAFGIRFSVKNYNAQMHNFVVNSHKSNSLKSTLSLLDTAKSDDGNDKLLVQATQAIFSHQNSGFNSNESENITPNLITNVIDNITKK